MVIFHIDVNNAFLSWESVYRLETLGEPLDLRTIPSAIGGNKENRHGIILAKSTPAKTFGVKTAETLGDALKKCPSLQIVPPRMNIYEEFSKKLMNLLQLYSDKIEKYSIDEAFVDMTGTQLLFGPPEQVAEQLRAHVEQELHFTVNIGVSSNKLLAKMASDFKKPNHVHTLYPHEIPTKMWPLPVNELFFVGRASTKKLRNLGILTIGQLAQTDAAILTSHFGKYGAVIHDYANGIDSSPVTTKRADNKGYGNQTTISHDVTNPDEAKQILLKLCESVGSRLRADNMAAGVVAITIRTFDFVGTRHQCTLPAPTDVTTELYHYSCHLFDQLWDGSPIRLLGVSTSKVTQDTSRQMNLLDYDKYIRSSKAECAVDHIRSRFGKQAMKRASSLLSPKDFP